MQKKLNPSSLAYIYALWGIIISNSSLRPPKYVAFYKISAFKEHVTENSKLETIAAQTLSSSMSKDWSVFCFI